MSNMSPPETLRSIGQEPDHGHGRLGQFVHSVLAEYLPDPPSVPRLHLGQNTLPDPPFPLSSHIPYAIPDGAWDNCGRDLLVFLESGAQSMRAQPTPDGAAFSQQHRMMQRLLRMDAIALALKAQTLRATDSVANWTLAADALAGSVDPADLDEADGVASVAAWAADRAGTSLLGWGPLGGTSEQIAVSDDLALDDPVIMLLREILDAQYAWTTKVFGSGPPVM
jgi:hypothetical protein